MKKLILLFFVVLTFSACNKNNCYKCKKADVTISSYCDIELKGQEKATAETTCNSIGGIWTAE